MAANKDYAAARYETETFGTKVFEFLKIASFDLLIYLMMLYAVNLYAYLGRHIVLPACAATMGACIISYIIVKMDRPNMLIAAKRNLFIYLGALIGAYYIIQQLNGIDSSQMGVSLGLNAGETQSNAAQGWITMMIQFLMVGSPIGFVSYEVKRIWTFYGFGHGHVTKRKRAEQLQRTIVKR